MKISMLQNYEIFFIFPPKAVRKKGQLFRYRKKCRKNFVKYKKFINLNLQKYTIKLEIILVCTPLRKDT